MEMTKVKEKIRVFSYLEQNTLKKKILGDKYKKRKKKHLGGIGVKNDFIISHWSFEKIKK